MLPLARLLLIIPRRLLLSLMRFTFRVSAASACAGLCERVTLAVNVTALTCVYTAARPVIVNEMLITIRSGLMWWNELYCRSFRQTSWEVYS